MFQEVAFKCVVAPIGHDTPFNYDIIFIADTETPHYVVPYYDLFLGSTTLTYDFL